MQAPTFAEFETFRKVSTWISDQASRLASAPPCELVEDKPIPSPLDIFQRFPDGATQRTLESASRAFRRFSSKVVAGCASRAQRNAAWRKVGVDLIVGENGRVLLHFVGLPGAESSPVRADPRERARATAACDGDWFASQVDPALWKSVADEIAEAGTLSLRELVRRHPGWAGTDILAAIEFSYNYLPEPLAKHGVTIRNNIYRIEF